MQFGVFDHMDASGEPLAELFENRLKLAEAYDRIGLYALHVAEHHSTPLGMSPSPSVFLAHIPPHLLNLLILACRVHAICQKDHKQLPVGIDPDGSSREARVKNNVRRARPESARPSPACASRPRAVAAW